jgi:hypothetical protein
MKRAIVAGWLGAVSFACLATAGAQTLPELSATLGVHDSAAASSASTAYGARDTIMRHLPQKSAGGDPWSKGSDTRAHSAGGFKTRPSPSSGGPRKASGTGWANGKSWARAGDVRQNRH